VATTTYIDSNLHNIITLSQVHPAMFEALRPRHTTLSVKRPPLTANAWCTVISVLHRYVLPRAHALPYLHHLYTSQAFCITCWLCIRRARVYLNIRHCIMLQALPGKCQTTCIASASVTNACELVYEASRRRTPRPSLHMRVR
jgi:hypothetical protein